MKTTTDLYCWYCHKFHPVPHPLEKQLGNNTLCPNGAILCSDEYLREDINELTESWYFERKKEEKIE